jgi:hypothetical protein
MPSLLMRMFAFQSEPGPVPLSWKQQGLAINGDIDDDYFGTSVALSADAKTLVVGAPGFFDNAELVGYVRVYYTDEDGGDRTQLGETIYGDAIKDQFGMSVDITADGRTLAVGSPGSIGVLDRPGYVEVYSLEGSNDLGLNWKQLGQDMS